LANLRCKPCAKGYFAAVECKLKDEIGKAVGCVEV
jgi:hypothetical protein